MLDPEVYISIPLGGWTGRGMSTLVLGAGISRSRGVPTWEHLVDELWKETFGEAGGSEPEPDHPFAPQMRLEMIHRRLADGGWDAVAKDLEAWWASQSPPRVLRLRGTDVRSSADDVFRELLRRALYRHVHRRPDFDSLGVLAEVVRQEAKRSASGRQRRLIRVITFNADSLLEREVNGVDDYGWAHSITLWPIVAPKTPPMRDAAAIPIYHVHGCLPLDQIPVKDAPPRRGKRWDENLYDDGDLVFKDAEYWASVASPLSFANRVVTNALHDSRCIFIGLSMTDVNLWRWLGIRAIEIEGGLGAEWTKARRRDGSTGGSGEVPTSVLSHEMSHEGHMWIRTDDADPTGQISRFLARQRGVRSLRIDGWDTAVLTEVFDRLFRDEREEVDAGE